MKTLLLLVIVGLWQIKIPQKAVRINSMPAKPIVAEVQIQTDRISYICDDRKYCSQMTTYEKAIFFNKNCPDTKMDADKYEYPCEHKFGN